MGRGTVVALFVAGVLLGASAMGAGYWLGGRTGSGTTPLPPLRNESAVEIMDFKFTPENLTVDVRTKVIWTNHDPGTVHTVTSDDAEGPLRSGNLSTGQSYSYLFAQEGTYKYHCIPHSTLMMGTIVVRTGGGGAP